MQSSLSKLAFNSYMEKQLSHRYIHNDFIIPLLKNLPKNFLISEIGLSVNQEPIYSITIGHGKKRILLWSQMHGNESTTTKALFDVLNAFKQEDAICNSILEACTIKIIPILNPDGARAYTRLNANGVDLNRDAQELTQPESIALKTCFETFKPDFCFNLHGQRTIFSAGSTNKTATISFLAPAQDTACSITPNRKIAMELITVLNDNLQKQIPNQVGIYDDAFNINCVGDMFQSHNVPTILFEAGHYPNDYAREETRFYIYQSLMLALQIITDKTLTGSGFKAYLSIPQNEKLFYDIIIRNALVKIDSKEETVDIGVQYLEKLNNNQIEFVPIIEKIKILEGFFGHKEYNANNQKVLAMNKSDLNEDSENDFVWINNDKYSLKLTKT